MRVNRAVGTPRWGPEAKARVRARGLWAANGRPRTRPGTKPHRSDTTRENYDFRTAKTLIRRELE